MKNFDNKVSTTNFFLEEFEEYILLVDDDCFNLMALEINLQ